MKNRSTGVCMCVWPSGWPLQLLPARAAEELIHDVVLEQC